MTGLRVKHRLNIEKEKSNGGLQDVQSVTECPFNWSSTFLVPPDIGVAQCQLLNDTSRCLSWASCLQWDGSARAEGQWAWRITGCAEGCSTKTRTECAYPNLNNEVARPKSLQHEWLRVRHRLKIWKEKSNGGLQDVQSVTECPFNSSSTFLVPPDKEVAQC